MLQRPFPRPESYRTKTVAVLGTGLFVAIFLFVFRPFGIGPAVEMRPEIVLYYGLVTVCGMGFVSLLLPRMFKAWYVESVWTQRRELIDVTMTILFIAMGNLLLSAYLFQFPIKAYFIVSFIGVTLAIGIFPSILFTFIRARHLDQKYELSAQLLNDHRQHLIMIDGEVDNMMSDTRIESGEGVDVMYGSISGTYEMMSDTRKLSNHVALHDDEQRQILDIPAADLLLIQGADNYVSVWYINGVGSSPTTALIRNTMSQIESQLARHSMFFRCHRSSIINLTAIQELIGNAQGYKAIIPGLPDVAIARSKSRAFRDLVNNQFTPNP